MKTMSKFVSVLTFAFTALAANMAAAGDIFEIRPCDEMGRSVDPAGEGKFLSSGETAYFDLRLVKRAESDNPFRLVHLGSGNYDVDLLTKRPGVGIYVNGRFTVAEYVTDLVDSSKAFTSFIFKYTVKPGELALPIRLARSDRSLITESSGPTVEYYLNFKDPSLGAPVWAIDNSTETVPATYAANFSFVDTPEIWMGQGPDGDGPVFDYNLSKCNFQVKAVDFDKADPPESATWRVVYEGDGVSNAAPARLIVSGIPEVSATLYLWAESEGTDDAFYVYGDKAGKMAEERDVTVSYGVTEKRHVLELKTIPGKGGEDYPYEFVLRGIKKGATGRLVLSAFPDFNYREVGGSMHDRVVDYLTVDVACCDPRPPTVTLAVKQSTVYANASPNVELTALEVKVYPAWPKGEELELSVVPGFTDASGEAAHKWYDYIRFANGRNKEVTLQTPAEYEQSPKLLIGADGVAKKLNGVDLEDPGVIYVYGLYADDYSNGTKGKLTLKAETENAEAQSDIRGWGTLVSLTVRAEAPALSTKADAVKATVNEPRSFDIKVEDVWNAMKDETGYKLYYQHTAEGEAPGDDAWKEVKDGAFWKPDGTGILKEAVEGGKSPTLTYPLANVTRTTWFYVTGPNGLTSGKEAEDALKLKVTVVGRNEVSARVSADDQATWVKSGKFKEGTELYVLVDLDEPLESGETVYAFLAPVGDAVECVSGDAVTNSEYTSGIEIEGGQKSAEIPSVFKITDGTKAGKGLKFDIVLCKTQQFDPANIVTGVNSKTLSLTALNVEPTFVQVTMDKVARVENSEETMHTGKGKTEKNALVPIGVAKKFEIKVAEPSDVDLQATGEGSSWGQKDFTIEWTVVEENGASGSGTLTGNPATTNFTYTFTGAGTAEVTLRMHDKDMTDWSEEFTFYVEVTAKSSVLVTAPEMITESMTGFAQAPVTLELSDHSTESITAKVTVVSNESAITDPLKKGFIRIGGAINDLPLVDGEGVEYYLVELKGGKAKLFVDECDGTDIANRKGFTIEASIVDTRIDPVSKKAWSDCYDPSSTLVYVGNEAPQLADCSLGATVAEGNTNAVKVGIGEMINVTYRVDDIRPDLTNGISVAWWDTDNKSAAVTNVYDNTNTVTFSTKFKTSGPKTIRVTLTDKDSKPTYVGEWYFSVESTKTLVTIPNGPTGKGDSTLSSRYAGASGAGQGHVWSDASFAYADTFMISWNCSPSAMSALVYGYGYKTNQVDNGSLVDPANRYFHDIPLSPLGNNTTESGTSALGTDQPTDYFKYEGDRDSFLYGWISHSAGESGGGSTGGGSTGGSGMTSTFKGLAPEYSERAPKPATANLPNGNANSAQGTQAVVNYPTTYLEAVFSKELLPSDNMGDINADGIPDAYLLVNDYNFGIIDAATGALSGDDLRNLNFTEGESPEPFCMDYLPAHDTAGYAGFIPGLEGTWVETGLPFVPRMKIRGFDEDDLQSIAKRGTSVSALNDAPLGIVPGVKPDRIYTNPREDAASTLNYVEWLAWSEFKAANPTATEKDWSPERPTNPTKADTDGDGITDGYEYYIWYRAHVGYVDANGRHRRLTGRRYDVRNPGEGVLITPEELELAFDPQNPTAYKLRDIDNDGLPDLLEFELGTNPFDFDTDGDGLADGWELMIAGLDPLLASSSADAKFDTERNYDGDAMAISSFQLEKAMKPVPFSAEHAKRVTFAVLDPNGDTDGVQWYAALSEPVTATQETSVAAWSFKAEGRSYVVYGVEPKTYDDPQTGKKILAVTYPKGSELAGTASGAFLSGEVEEFDEPALDEDGNPVPSTEQALDEDGNPMTDPATGDPIYVPLTNHIAVAERGYPVRVEAGVEISDVKEGVKPIVLTIADEIDAKTINAAWIYGRGTATNLVGDVAKTAAEYGCLALGRQQAPAKGAVICAAVTDERDVAFLHYLCYQEFGFDPRTAWKAKDPLATRWSKSIDGEAVEGITTMKAGGFTGAPARTRDYAAYDEFLVCSFFQNNGCDMSGITFVTDDSAPAMAKFWGAFTTNPQGPNEPDLINAEHYYGRNSDNGADTDGDGVPDGWELYVMSGPKNGDGTYVFAPAYAGFATALSGPDYPMPQSYFSPFLDFAQKTETSNQIYLGGQTNDDLLNEYQEFEGTDTMAYYAAHSATVVHTDAWKWLNKFFPTDPWSRDTDGDGIDDKAEGQAFVYGSPADDGKLWSIPGGGLNPCSVDTDSDGLPDPWESQFKGKTPYTEANAMRGSNGEALIDFAKDADGAPIGNALQGLVDGMDGTVADAFSYPITRKQGSDGTITTTYIVANGFKQVVNRDYDRDGLENWQEYLTGTMRCWRYDDPYSPWQAIPTDWYFSKNADGELEWNPLLDKFGLESDDFDGFWYMTLVDDESPYYNPHLITDQNQGAQYFSPVTNGWDVAYNSWQLGGATSYYWFYDRIGNKLIKDYWVGSGLAAGPLAECLSEGMLMAPTKYCSCSPIEPDSDHDGMDDYYELFHGMNPLLGESGVALTSEGPCDLVFDAWFRADAGALEAWGVGVTKNYWQRNPDKLPAMPRGTGYDFVVFPWLNGAAGADPDGDDVRNDEESIMAGVAPAAAWHHTDPTPLWMTDSSYTNSLVRQYFRMPAGLGEVKLDKPFFMNGETKYYFRDFDGFTDKTLTSKGMVMDPYAIEMFSVDQWSVTGEGLMNWMYSFEENEGFDTDHDGISDHEELESKFRAGTDPQDADSPRRRQAMYFQGKDRPSALQTMPFVKELHPIGATGYPEDLSFLQYTVECWAMPEALDDATLVERAVYVGKSNPGDEEYMRKNFQIGLKNGKWYTKFDPNGTLSDNAVEVLSVLPAKTGEWTHLAATYDGTFLTLYVNGRAEKPARSGLQPSTGTSAVALLPNQSYWFDREYPLQAVVIGASFRTNGEGAPDGEALDVTLGRGWDRYTRFYKGYVDEVRVWDGVRTGDEIVQAMNVRFTAAEAKQNRERFYGQWAEGLRRYAKDGTGKDADVIAELRYHWAFDSVFGAENEKAVVKVPHGFGPDGLKAPVSRPEGYGIAWYAQVLKGGDGKPGYEGAVYDDPLWVTWIPNTVTHLPRFDGTTLDSMYWSDDFRGDVAGQYALKKTAEPVSRWTQMTRNGVSVNTQYWSTDARHQLVNGLASGTGFALLYEFAGRHLNQVGDDLLPLGGAYVKYVPREPGLWDKQGASSVWELTGSDADGDGLPDWWEIYAEQNYREGVDPTKPISWNEPLLNYNGVPTTPGEAYMRDLAHGGYVGEDGKVHVGVTDYLQTADTERSGMPDWWAEMYGIKGESGLDDHDHDGLPNYVEYLLSEVFAFKGLRFDPTIAKSVDPETPDYFIPVGNLYVGEIFTDHDLVDDAWEDLYSDGFASRLAWDALADADEDGWSNRSENRYSKAVMPIVADKRDHNTPADGLVADYPIPTLALKLRYNGNRQNLVNAAPIAVQVTTDGAYAKDPDATYLIGAAANSTAGTGNNSDKVNNASATEVARTRTIGKWSDRHVIGTLTPGNIKINTIRLQACYDPSSVIYSWVVYTWDLGIYDKRGTRAEYDNDLQKYGNDNVKLLSMSTDYKDVQNLELRGDEKSIVATWFLKTGDVLGTVNLATGEFDLDLGKFKNWTFHNSTNESEVASMEDQTFRIAYATNPSVGLPRELYLGAADKGHVKEGKNTIVAWADLDGDGAWTVGEPYGIARGVDVSWKGTSVEIELTDTSAILPRVNLPTDESDRGLTRDEMLKRVLDNSINRAFDEQWIANNRFLDATTVADGSFKGQRIRVVRWLVNGVPVYRAGTSARVVLDKMIETDVRSCLTEADILVGNENAFDLDWANLRSEVTSNFGTLAACGNVTDVSYLIVVGDGSVAWDDATATNTVAALQTVITRKYGETHVVPTPIAPGTAGGEIVQSANPTFKWKMDCPADEAYTAFRIQVSGEAGTVYDSGVTLAPSKVDGAYVWAAPLYVGDKTLSGKVFENKAAYTWKVSMYNSKFTEDAYSNAGRFYLDVQTNGYHYGTANVAVRYFGPKSTWAGGAAKSAASVIRVRAYTSPDFTGTPVAAGYVADPANADNGVAVTGKTVQANCQLNGLPRGTYYFQAFVDSNGNGVCDPWETSGYLCSREGTTADSLDPKAMTFGDELGASDLAVIYLEDADTDGDGLPDGWEYAEYGSLTAKGVELLSETAAGEFLVNAKLSGALKLQANANVPTAGLAGRLGSRLLSNAGMLALAAGAPTAGYATFSDAISGSVEPALVEGGVRITALDLADGKVTIRVEAETDATQNEVLKSLLDVNGALEVICDVKWTPTLAEAPKTIKTQEITVGVAEAEIDVSAAVPESASGFFSVEVRKK